MSKLRQNLFLFFEEKAQEYDIDWNLVMLAMNRFVVDEDAQFEVIGVYYLKKSTKEMIDYYDPAHKYFVKERAEKDAFDKDLISEAIDHAMLYPNVDTHFIFGTLFGNTMYNPHSKKSVFHDWFSQEVARSEIRSLLYTQYMGQRIALISKAQSIKFYEGKMSVNLVLKSSPDSDDGWWKPRSSVHDDLEKFIHHIRNGHKIVPDRGEPAQNSLFLLKMLTTNELQKTRNKDGEFWRTLLNSNKFRERCKQDYTTECDDFDKKHKFVHCFCIRYSFRFK